MKIFTLYLFLIISIVAFSQETQGYYIVAKENHSIEPTQKTQTSNGQLTLSFQNAQLQTFFNNKIVYKYEKAFPTAETKLLQRTYEVNLVGENHLQDLINLVNVEHVELVPVLESLTDPNDYTFSDDSIFDDDPMTQLELVRANYAWDITRGSENVLIGIADTIFNIYHEDLVNKIVYHYGSSSTHFWEGHGTAVAGAAAADTDNDIGIASTGFDTRLVTRSPYSYNALLQVSQYPGVKVVNASWGSPSSSSTPSIVTHSVIEEIWNNGILIVASAGNGGRSVYNPTLYYYPASYENVFSVSSVGHNFDYGNEWIDESNHLDWRDRHEYINRSTGTLRTHQHNDKVDLVAPGYDFLTTWGNNHYARSSGTSFASPMVAGAAALVFSINPNFTPQQVTDILKSTADDIYWIPENQQFQGLLGTGRLNVFRAVKTAKCMMESPSTYNIDLLIRDSRDDKGEEPNNETQYMWTSNDIFIRNQNDGKLIPVHQNPVYDAVNPNYVYVRVTNLGCQTSSGNDTVTVNWAKANTSLQYPEFWNGDVVINNVDFGGEVGTGIVPPLEPGQEALVAIPWLIPNPADYVNINDNPWHFCLLAEINSGDDPLSSPYTSNPNEMVENNNNLAWRNVTIIDVSEENNAIGAAVAVNNPSAVERTFFLELVKEDLETGKPIYDEAEVVIKMDDIIYAAWERGGKLATKIDDTNDERRKKVKGNNVILENLHFYPKELGTVYVSFNFLTKELTDKNKFRYHLIQKDAVTGEVMGGETFEIKKKSRNKFFADAGGTKEIDKNESIMLTAEEIFEAAIYNWYDEEGNLIYSGKNFEVTPDVTMKYKLEVIAEDGFKDYAEVQVNVTPYKLISISPNPANSQITVNYDIENSASAYIMITNIINGTSNNYVLDVNSTSNSINLNNYHSGNYSVTLICDGQIVASKGLIKN